MMPHSPLSLLWVANTAPPALSSLAAFLDSIPHVQLTRASQWPADLGNHDVVISLDGGGRREEPPPDLEGFVRNGGGWLTAIDAGGAVLPELLGVSCDPPGPEAELRILFEKADHPLAARLPDAVYLPGRHRGLRLTREDTESLLYADWHYDHTPVLAQRAVGRGRVAATTLEAFDHPVLQRILHRLAALLAGRPIDPPALGVGLLGYAPSVGRIHGLGITETPGLRLAAVCDLNPERVAAARQDFPDIAVRADAEALGSDAAVDLVIVATPPNTHAALCLDLMAAGKHVVCEKPLALNRRETDALQSAAEKQQVHLSCHQNRRWDPDYLAIRESLARGLIGDLFYMETFVGGYHHPCGYWHSHAAVSGGTTYDWGAHYLDWIVSLISAPVEAVIGTRHKRVWRDVTNADQERIQIRFAGGVEAEFMHSDIAAARKPQWYLLGTRGAITGRWRDVATHTVDPDHYYRRHDIPATEMTPAITITQRRAEGEIVRITPPVAERTPYAFHRNLADHLLLGEPIGAPLADSVKVVAILEAAARSMSRGGTPEVLDGD